ncbi:MAG: hypothetical protein ABJH52_12045 [Henriciella sp.]
MPHYWHWLAKVIIAASQILAVAQSIEAVAGSVCLSTERLLRRLSGSGELISLMRGKNDRYK